MMAIFSILWLLAAFSTTVISGPVPQRFRRLPSPYYKNTSSIMSSSFSQSGQETTTFTNLPSPASGISTSAPQTAEVDTAIIVNPISRTVFTKTQPPITFVDPHGRPLVTQSEETLLSTSYKKPTATPTPDVSSSYLTATLSETSDSVRRTKTSIGLSGGASSPTSLPQTTGNGYNGPKFTYSPDQNEQSNSTRSSQSANNAPAQETHTSAANSAAASAPQLMNGTSPVVEPTIVPRPSHNSSGIESSSATQSRPSSQVSRPASTGSMVIVTQTQYTTITPSVSSTTGAQSPSGVPSFETSPLASSQAAGSPASGHQPGASSTSSSSDAGLPSLSPPPFVVVTTTQYTTTTPTAPASSATPINSPSSSISPSTSQAGASEPATPSHSVIYSTAATSPTVTSTNTEPASTQLTSKGSGGFGGGFNYPSHQPAPTPTSSSAKDAPSASESPASSTNAVSSSPSNIAPAPSSSSDAAASSGTPDSPLIVTPINPSQLFTVTVTTTTTEKEKETVTVTATA